MVGCAVKSCRKRQYKGSGIHFFSFPTDPKHRDIWIERICREHFEPTVHSRVCSLHFEDSCFEKDPAVLKSIDWKLDRPKIKLDAVPTIALEEDIEFDEKLVNGETQVARPNWNGLGPGGKTAKQQEMKHNRRFKKKKKRCQCKHTYICDNHKNVIQRARNKRKRSPHSDDENDTADMVDFSSLQISTLRRYRRHFKLQNKAGMNKSQLLETISRHFKSIPVPEKETITYFIYMVKTHKSKLDQRPGENA